MKIRLIVVSLICLLCPVSGKEATPEPKGLWRVPGVELGMSRLELAKARPEAKLASIDGEPRKGRQYTGPYIEGSFEAEAHGYAFLFEDDRLVSYTVTWRNKGLEEKLEVLRQNLRKAHGDPERVAIARSTMTGGVEKLSREIYGSDPVVLLVATKAGGIELIIGGRKGWVDQLGSYEEQVKRLDENGLIGEGEVTDSIDLLGEAGVKSPKS